ncbi:hypothetical protein BC827DRAFT_1220507 [Russula dissimulans]|nr:hypothetical protein BC827DRAFT_1220507 [Russula dissimulans]
MMALKGKQKGVTNTGHRALSARSPMARINDGESRNRLGLANLLVLYHQVYHSPSWSHLSPSLDSLHYDRQPGSHSSGATGNAEPFGKGMEGQGEGGTKAPPLPSAGSDRPVLAGRTVEILGPLIALTNTRHTRLHQVRTEVPTFRLEGLRVPRRLAV